MRIRDKAQIPTTTKPPQPDISDNESIAGLNVQQRKSVKMELLAAAALKAAEEAVEAANALAVARASLQMKKKSYFNHGEGSIEKYIRSRGQPMPEDCSILSSKSKSFEERDAVEDDKVQRDASVCEERSRENADDIIDEREEVPPVESECKSLTSENKEVTQIIEETDEERMESEELVEKKESTPSCAKENDSTITGKGEEEIVKAIDSEMAEPEPSSNEQVQTLINATEPADVITEKFEEDTPFDEVTVIEEQLDICHGNDESKEQTMTKETISDAPTKGNMYEGEVLLSDVVEDLVEDVVVKMEETVNETVVSNEHEDEENLVEDESTPQEPIASTPEENNVDIATIEIDVTEHNDDVKEVENFVVDETSEENLPESQETVVEDVEETCLSVQTKEKDTEADDKVEQEDRKTIDVENNDVVAVEIEDDVGVAEDKAFEESAKASDNTEAEENVPSDENVNVGETIITEEKDTIGTNVNPTDDITEVTAVQKEEKQNPDQVEEPVIVVGKAQDEESVEAEQVNMQEDVMDDEFASNDNEISVLEPKDEASEIVEDVIIGSNVLQVAEEQATEQETDIEVLSDEAPMDEVDAVSTPEQEEHVAVEAAENQVEEAVDIDTPKDDVAESVVNEQKHENEEVSVLSEITLVDNTIHVDDVVESSSPTEEVLVQDMKEIIEDVIDNADKAVATLVDESESDTVKVEDTTEVEEVVANEAVISEEVTEEGDEKSPADEEEYTTVDVEKDIAEVNNKEQVQVEATEDIAPEEEEAANVEEESTDQVKVDENEEVSEVQDEEPIAVEDKAVEPESSEATAIKPSFSDVDVHKFIAEMKKRCTSINDEVSEKEDLIAPTVLSTDTKNDVNNEKEVSNQPAVVEEDEKVDEKEEETVVVDAVPTEVIDLNVEPSEVINVENNDENVPSSETVEIESNVEPSSPVEVVEEVEERATMNVVSNECKNESALSLPVEECKEESNQITIEEKGEDDVIANKDSTDEAENEVDKYASTDDDSQEARDTVNELPAAPLFEEPTLTAKNYNACDEEVQDFTKEIKHNFTDVQLASPRKQTLSADRESLEGDEEVQDFIQEITRNFTDLHPISPRKQMLSADREISKNDDEVQDFIKNLVDTLSQDESDENVIGTDDEMQNDLKEEANRKLLLLSSIEDDFNDAINNIDKKSSHDNDTPERIVSVGQVDIEDGVSEMKEAVADDVEDEKKDTTDIINEDDSNAVFEGMREHKYKIQHEVILATQGQHNACGSGCLVS